MTPFFPGRFAAHSAEPFVVFLVGIAIHRPLAVHRWWPAFAPMLPMVRELEAHPEVGMLGSRFYLSWPVILVIQYWHSFDQLEAFARQPQHPHLPAWQRFNQAVGKSNVVGVFHETYRVEAGQYEAVYVNMPRFGLGKAAEHRPATGPYLTARRRLGGQNEAAVKFGDESG